MDHENYKRKLKQLMENPELRKQFGQNSMEKMKAYSRDRIGKEYLGFLIAET